jgi:NADH-quinone oxidoreductase subunit H
MADRRDPCNPRDILRVRGDHELFLGGWKGPFGDEYLGWLWTLVKVFAVSFVVSWLRVSYPRLREDQLQRLCWLVLVPAALGQLVLTVAVRVAIDYL